VPRLDRIVVVGASLAGQRAAETLRLKGFRGDLVIVGAERHQPYDRVPLSKRYLVADMTHEELLLPHLTDLDARWLFGVRATALDTVRQQVALDGGRQHLGYDGLVIATGVAPRRLAGVDAAARGIHVLRSLEDASALKAALATRPRHVLVIGGGFIGAEVASTVRDLDLDVTLVDAETQPLSKQFGSQIAAWIGKQHRRHGIRTCFGRRLESLDGTAGRMRARLTDGHTITADLVVVALGAVPNTDWLTGSGLHLDDGVLTDAGLFATGACNVVAAGDVVRYPHPLCGDPVRVEHWSNAVDTAGIAAANLLRGRGAATPMTALPILLLRLHGHQVRSVGLPTAATESAVVDGSPDEDRFVVAFSRQGVLVGAVAVNAARALPPFHRAIADRARYSVGAST
jgi:NADPH-dependent 2,4-dienoyl-CoA reductase/sulfur reductase-like enzyme